MICRAVRYRIRPEALEEVKKAVRKFVACVHDAEPGTEYRAFQLEDELSFLHLMVFPDEAAEDRHRNAPYTSDFVAVLHPNCSEEPVFTNATEIR